MKFLRHFTVVVLAVTVIVGLGMLWAHASGGGTGAEGLRRVPSHETLLRLRQIKAGAAGDRPGSGFHSGTRDLIKTCMVETVLATIVITVSAVRRRQRRMRRTAAAKA